MQFKYSLVPRTLVQYTQLQCAQKKKKKLWGPQYIVIPLMLALNEWDDGPDLVSPTTNSSPVGRTRVQLVE